MTRFEIQDIASQNQDGVTFRALDKSTDQIVSLRRFFPFGQDEEGGEGFNQKDGEAFSSACQNLSQVEHPALRKTIFGDTDPVDGMPFLVTEWIEGESLADVLGNDTMDPAMTIGLVRLALDVCMTLSVTLENEAVWIDTKLESIIVSNPSENPTFSFRICPFKWLGTQSHTRDLTGIVSLVEALMGWNSKPVNDFAGLGLGGWLKLLRQNPQMGLNDALLSLPDSVTKLTAETKTANTTNQPDQQPYILKSTNQSLFTKKRISIMALSACFTGALIFFLYQQNSKKSDATAHNDGDKNTIVEQQTSTPEILPIIDTTKLIVETTTPKTKSWSPSEIPTAAWYDASNSATITASNGLVSQWNDISGNENHATQSSNALKPQTGTRTINDLNAIDFDADKLSRVELDMSGKAIFAVILADKTSEGGQIFSHSTMNNQLRVVPGGQIRYAANPPHYDNSRASTDTLSMEKPGIAGFILNTTLQFSVNGVFDDTLASKRATVGTAFNQFGAREENKEGFDGLIGEIIITDSIPDTDVRQKIEGYLAHKWGLTENLPADHLHKLSAPASLSSESESLKDLPKTKIVPLKTEPDPPNMTLWSPAEIPSTAWYDASTATFKDGTVSIVNAGSGGGAISGPASLAANGIGNLQAVQFNGSSQYLTGDCTNAGTSLTVFFVGKSLNTNQAPFAGMMSIWENSQTFDWDNVSSSVLFSQNDTLVNSIYSHRNRFKLSSATGKLTDGFLATSEFNGSIHTFYLNGTPSAAVPSTNSFNANKVILGARWQASAIAAPHWNGNFGEAIICNADLSTSDRQKIEGYLAHKWSLLGNLPADHPYKLSAPTYSTSKAESLEIPQKPKVDPPEKKLDPPKTEPTPKITLWSPIEIPTTAWYDAADALTITAKSGAVSQWRDKSGNSLHLGQGAAANQPTTGAKINGREALDFTGDSMTTASNPFGATVSDAFVIVVHKVDSIQNGILFSLTGSDAIANRWNGHAPWLDGSMFFDCGAAAGPNRAGTSYGVSPGHVVLTSFYSSTTNNVQQVYKNGSLLVGDSSGHAVSTVGNISVGGVATGYQDTTIGEFIIINGTVDDATRQKLEGYLAHEWATTASLPANHPYKSSAPTGAPQILDVLTPQNTEYIKTLKESEPVTLQGIVRSAIFSSTEKSIYISFSDPVVETDIRVVIHGSEYEGGPFTEEAFAPLIGKDLVFNGAVYTEKFNDKPPFVKITAKEQIKVATESTQNKLAIATTPGPVSKPDTVSDIPILVPNDIKGIAKLKLEQPAAVKGIVKLVKIPKPGFGLYISFSDPIDAKQINVVLYPKPFEGGPYGDAQFKKIEDEYQKLVGKTVTFHGNVHRQKDQLEPHFIYVGNRGQIKIEEQAQKTAIETPKVIYTPEDLSKIKLLEEKSPVKLVGILNDAKLDASRTAIIFNFSRGEIQGVVNKLSFKDDFDQKSFDKFKGKKIVLDGVLTNDRSKDLYRIEIDELSDITIAPK